MKKELKFAAIVLLILAHTINKGNAQVAGYMGKRFTIGYSNYFFPAIMGPGALTGAKYGLASPGFNTTHCINLEYAVKPRTNFTASAQYLQTGIGIRYLYTTRSDEYTYRSNYSNPIVLSSVNIGLGFKFFRRGTLAPLGKYSKFELLMLFETVTYDKTQFTTQVNGNTTDATLGEGIYNYKNFTITYTIGRQRIFFNALVVDYGIRFGVSPLVVPSFLLNDGYHEDIETIFRDDSRYRIFRQQLVNLHLGIGFLAF
jgi:hypothetical protein